MIEKKVLLVVNTPAPCRIPLYNLLNKKIKNFKILFMDKGGWKNLDEKIKFNYEILEKSRIARFIEEKVFGEQAQSHFNKKCFNKIKEFNPDIIISGGGIVNTLNIMAYLYCLIFKKELIIWEAMSYKFSSRMSFLSKILRKIFYKKTKSFIVYGKSTRKFLQSYGIHQNKIYIGPNTIDIEKFKTGRKKDNTFLYVGRFSPEKNILFMLKAFNQKLTKDYKLILIGAGEQEKEIQEFIKKNKMEEKVTEKEFIKYDEIKEYYKNADFLILPSTWEPWGLVVNEAIGSGTIPIISNVCGSSELITNGITGFKFSPYDLNKFKKLLKKIIESDINKKTIRKNLQDLKEQLTIEKYAKAFENAINKI